MALFVRTTRALTLTDIGSDFLMRIEPSLAEIDDGEDGGRGSGELHKVLRTALGTNFAVPEVTPRLSVFMSRYLELRIEFDDR